MFDATVFCFQAAGKHLHVFCLEVTVSATRDGNLNMTDGRCEYNTLHIGTISRVHTLNFNTAHGRSINQHKAFPCHSVWEKRSDCRVRLAWVTHLHHMALHYIAPSTYTTECTSDSVHSMSKSGTDSPQNAIPRKPRTWLYGRIQSPGFSCISGRSETGDGSVGYL